MDEKLKKQIVDIIKSLRYQARYNPRRDWEDEEELQKVLDKSANFLESIGENGTVQTVQDTIGRYQIQ